MSVCCDITSSRVFWLRGNDTTSRCRQPQTAAPIQPSNGSWAGGIWRQSASIRSSARRGSRCPQPRRQAPAPGAPGWAQLGSGERWVGEEGRSRGSPYYLKKKKKKKVKQE